MSARIEIPFPPHRSDPATARVSPPWVPVEPRWEYRQIMRDLANEGVMTEAELNSLGNEHWELAGIMQEAGRAHYYFKRERTR